MIRIQYACLAAAACLAAISVFNLRQVDQAATKACFGTTRFVGVPVPVQPPRPAMPPGSVQM